MLYLGIHITYMFIYAFNISNDKKRVIVLKENKEAYM